MAYLTVANFRPDTTAAACMGLVLTEEEAPDGDLTTGIAAVSQRIDSLTNDHFENQDEATLDVDVTGYSNRLYLPRRCTNITTLKTRDHLGNLTTQASTQWRLRGSLDATGATKLYDVDYVEILTLGTGIAGPDITDPWTWPCGTEVVQIVGDFGWLVTPGDIKRATALLVWDTFKREAGDVRRAQRWARGDLTVERAVDSKTGLPEADDLLEPYVRGGGGYGSDLLVMIG